MAKDVCMLFLLIYCASMHGKPYKYTVYNTLAIRGGSSSGRTSGRGVVVGELYALSDDPNNPKNRDS